MADIIMQQIIIQIVYFLLSGLEVMFTCNLRRCEDILSSKLNKTKFFRIATITIIQWGGLMLNSEVILETMCPRKTEIRY